MNWLFGVDGPVRIDLLRVGWSVGIDFFGIDGLLRVSRFVLLQEWFELFLRFRPVLSFGNILVLGQILFGLVAVLVLIKILIVLRRIVYLVVVVPVSVPVVGVLVVHLRLVVILLLVSPNRPDVPFRLGLPLEVVVRVLTRLQNLFNRLSPLLHRLVLLRNILSFAVLEGPIDCAVVGFFGRLERLNLVLHFRLWRLNPLLVLL